MMGVSLVMPGEILPFQLKDVRHADAAFVEHSFAALERRIVGDAVTAEAGGFVTADAAIVARENDERVIGEIQFVERRDYAADTFVDARDHRGVRGIFMPADWWLGFELGDQILLCLMRGVHAEVRQIQEERFVLVAFDEVDGVIGEEIGEILCPWDSRSSDLF